MSSSIRDAHIPKHNFEEAPSTNFLMKGGAETGELREDGEDSDADNGSAFKAEAKIFSWLHSDGYFLLKESHRKGYREICLTVEQSLWICEVLSEKNKCFGVAKRKVSRRFDGVVVSVFEGKNNWGSFSSIQVKAGMTEPNFLIIPGGFQGHIWGTFARWLNVSVSSEENSSFKKQLDKDLVWKAPLLSNKARSFTEVVMSSQVDSESTSVIRALQDHISILNTKIEAVLAELSNLRASVCSGFSVWSGGAPCVLSGEDESVAFASNSDQCGESVQVNGGNSFRVVPSPSDRKFEEDKLDGVSNSPGSSKVQEKARFLEEGDDMGSDCTLTVNQSMPEKSEIFREDDDVGSADSNFQISNLDQNLTSLEKITKDSELSASHVCFEREENTGSGGAQKTAPVLDKTKVALNKSKAMCGNKMNIKVAFGNFGLRR